MRRVMIVEDEKEIRENLEILMASENYEVLPAANGLEALKLLEKSTPDIIISDIMMPYINGYELFQRLQQDLKMKLIPFIFLTAKSEVSSVRYAMNLGADDYICKPFASEELLRAISTRLKKYDALNEQVDVIRSSISKYVPHELRTPLVAIMGYSQIILNEKDNLETKEIFDMVERINYSSRRLHNRIEKFLQLSDLEISQGNTSPADESAAGIDEGSVREIILSHYSIRESNSKIEVYVDKALLDITPACLNMILRELLENAVKFSENNLPVVVKGTADAEYYDLSVSDNGIGMSRQEIDAISAFRQFGRDENQYEGNGLGLEIVKKILAKINGRLNIESIKNNCTTVTVKIPLRK